MKKYFLVLLFFCFAYPSSVFAQMQPNVTSTDMPQEKAYVGRVTNIINEGTNTYGAISNPYQNLEITILSKEKKGQKIEIEHGKLFTLKEDLIVKENEKVVLLAFQRPDGSTEYAITEKYRLDKLIALTLSFFFLILGLAKFKGLGSILGLIISFFVIIKWIVPQILAGNDPLTATLLGCGVIMASTIFLAHGFNRKTIVAFGAIIITFFITGFLSLLFVSMAKISGLGSDDAYSLQLGLGGIVNFKGLFLSGMIIGTLGVLDDIATSLSASVFELAKTGHYQSFSKLFAAGFRIGTEHISSLVNTLVLAYAGTSLPLMLFIVINPSQKPLWSILNSELIAEEIVRSLVGSFSLVLAVPITLVLAAYISLRLRMRK